MISGTFLYDDLYMGENCMFRNIQNSNYIQLPEDCPEFVFIKLYGTNIRPTFRLPQKHIGGKGTIIRFLYVDPARYLKDNSNKIFISLYGGVSPYETAVYNANDNVAIFNGSSWNRGRLYEGIQTTGEVD